MLCAEPDSGDNTYALLTFLMEHFSIFGQSISSEAPVAAPLPAANAAAALPPISPEPLRFPGDDGGKSLAEMAEQDLEAALQLLAERAQFVTGASGAAIGLCEGREMVCRASAGPCAPAVGVQLQIHSGLTGESVRTRQVLRCDDAETDPRVNRESCHAMGVRSVMVMPLMREQEVFGVFELLAGRPQAFEDRDVTALERLAEIILTAVEHADAAKRALREIAEAPASPEPESSEPGLTENEKPAPARRAPGGERRRARFSAKGPRIRPKQKLRLLPRFQSPRAPISRRAVRADFRFPQAGPCASIAKPPKAQSRNPQRPQEPCRRQLFCLSS